MRASLPNFRARRRGQALLLAVLIMIFAALISAAFIGVVATNLNQTARQTDKDRAVVAARAGMDYINRQLSFSAEGDKWRTQLANNPPAPGDPTYNVYYSQLDLAQGWAGQYSKFPDPRGPVQNGPQFLARVERIDNSLPNTDPDYGKPELFGSLRISVIGLSPDDPTAFHRITARKGGFQQSPLANSMRTVGNYDFKTNQVLVAQGSTTNDGTNATTRALSAINAQGDFSKLVTPFAITLSEPRDIPPGPARSAVVTAVTPIAGSSTQFTFTLAQALTNTTKACARVKVNCVDDPAIGVTAVTTAVTPIAGSSTQFTFTLAQALTNTTKALATTRIELAANLGGPSGIDADNNNSTTTLTSFSNGKRSAEGG